MITIPWKKLTVKCSDRTLTADIGDIRVNLADNGTN